MSVGNDYSVAIQGLGGLFAVMLSDGGWSVADGPGCRLSRPEEIHLAGWHLPVRFESEDASLQAIRSGPDAWFDIDSESAWTRHCLAQGASVCAAYASPWAGSKVKMPGTVAELAREIGEAVWRRIEPPLWWEAIQDHIVADGAIGGLRAHMVAGHVEGVRIVRGAFIVGRADWPGAQFSRQASHLSAQSDH